MGDRACGGLIGSSSLPISSFFVPTLPIMTNRCWDRVLVYPTASPAVRKTRSKEDKISISFTRSRSRFILSSAQ